MNQGGFIVAALAAAFVLYLAKAGRLVTYATVFTGGSAIPAGGATGGGLG